VTVVLAQLGAQGAEQIAAAVPSVTVIDVPMRGDVSAEVKGDVLVVPSGYVDNLTEVLGRGVRWVHEFGTGVDSVPLDLVFAEEGRVLTCSRGASAIPIAEWVLAQMLAFEKHLPEAWLHRAPEHWNIGHGLGELHSKTVGIVGLGGIGTRVAELARGFGCEVVAARRTDVPSPLDGVRVGPLDEVLGVAQHLVLAAPATAQTRHLLDEAAFSRMPRGAHIVNVGRGSLIDQDALRVALDDGTVARASLDVCTPEPLPDGHWLYEHPQVHLSPHISWSSPHGLERILQGFIENLRRWESGDPLHHVVDPHERY